MSEPVYPIEDSKPVTPDKLLALAQRISLGETGEWFIYCIQEGKFYQYTDDIWQKRHDIDMLGILSVYMPKLNKHPLQVRRKILDELKILTRKSVDLFNRDGWLNFRQGLYDPYDDKLHKHHPDQFSTIRIPYNYNWNAKCPLWLKTLEEIFEGNADKASVLQEFFGYCLTRDTTQEKAMLLLGESRTGKSTILQVLRATIGDENCSSVPLKFISNPQYTPLLINKMVNIDSDVSGKAEAFEAEFKIITSGEPVTVNQKFIETFKFNPYCKLVMAANEFPRITDHSSAFYKRLIVIPCDRVFEEDEQNRRLKLELMNELPGVLNWAVEGLQRLRTRGMFERKNFMAEALAHLREESNPIEAFFKDFIIVDLIGDVEITKIDLYDKYKDWCEDNGNYPLSSVKFGIEVYRKYSKSTPKSSRSSMIGRPWVWKNLKLSNNHQPQGTEIEGWQDVR